MVIGHESAGEVLECGPGVSDLQPGDRVVGERLPLDDINRGLDRQATGQAMRDVILF